MCLKSIWWCMGNQLLQSSVHLEILLSVILHHFIKIIKDFLAKRHVNHEPQRDIFKMYINYPPDNRRNVVDGVQQQRFDHVAHLEAFTVVMCLSVQFLFLLYSTLSLTHTWLEHIYHLNSSVTYSGLPSHLVQFYKTEQNLNRQQRPIPAWEALYYLCFSPASRGLYSLDQAWRENIPGSRSFLSFVAQNGICGLRLLCPAA